MSRVEKSVLVRNTPERVIEYIADVENHPAFIGPLKSVSNLRGDPRTRGTSWDWTFVMAGVEFSGKSQTVSYVPGREFAFRTDDGIESTFTYRAEPADGGTRLSITVEYAVPGSLAAKMQTAVVERLNDAEGGRAVENIKAILDE